MPRATVSAVRRRPPLLLAVVVLLLLVVAGGWRCVAAHAGEPTAPTCGPTASYQHRAPRTPDAFEATVVEGAEVFAVRFHNESELACRQVAATWEKFAITYHARIRLVTYYMDGGPVSEVMARYLGAAQQGLPNLRLYVARAARVAARPPAVARPELCSAELTLDADVAGLAARLAHWDAGGGVDADADAGELLVEDEGERLHESPVLPPGARLRAEYEAARHVHERQLDSLADVVTQCRPARADAALVAPVMLMSGDGLSFSQLRRKVDPLLVGLRANAEGFLLKRDGH